MLVQHVHETEITDAHIGLSDSCILCSQNLLVFICLFDWNRLPTKELELYYLPNGRQNKTRIVNASILCMRQILLTNAL